MTWFPRYSRGYLHVRIRRDGLILSARIVAPYAPLMPPADIVGRNVAELVTEPVRIMAAITAAIDLNAPLSLPVTTVNGHDARNRIARITPERLRSGATVCLFDEDKTMLQIAWC